MTVEVCPKCGERNLIRKSIGDCNHCGTHSEWYCFSCKKYSDGIEVRQDRILITK